MSAANVSLTPERQARAALWSQGVVAAWYLRRSQLDIYELLTREKNPFVEAARRFGKTTTILAHVMERLRQNPGWVCRWCEPWKEQAREIVMPEVDKLQADCPDNLRFRFHVTGSVYVHPNGSRIYLRGVNEDRGESARGPTANIIVADEFGSWKDPEYTVNEVLRPQLLTTNGQFIFASSPAEDLSHPYYEHKARAISEKRFIQKTIYDNESLSPEKIEEIIREVGGAHKPAWLREYLCQPVSDPERLVIPEYDPDRHDCEDDAPRPAFADQYVGLDFGVNDHTAALFAYVDFEARTLVIEDELFINGRNTAEITARAKEVEGRLWGELKPYARWGDNQLQTIIDMNQLHGYVVNATDKHNKMDWINGLRLLFSEGRIKISKRCENLRYQLKVGLWNERKTDFARGEKTGHLDLIAALIYLFRNVNWAHNPFPSDAGVSIYTHFTESPSLSRPKEEDALASAFDPLLAQGEW